MPIANAGSDKLFIALRDNQIVEVNDTIKTVVALEKVSELTIHLNGSASFDADNDPLNYQWKVVEKPQNSQVLLNGNLTVSPTLVVDRLGDYVLELTVSDGTANSGADRITLFL